MLVSIEWVGFNANPTEEKYLYKRKDFTMEKKTLNITIYDRGRGYDTYKVTNYEEYDDDTLINKCDPNNWGGTVARYSNGYAIVKVYTD